MDQFELVTEFEPSGDQPQAIDELSRGVEEGLSHQVLLWVTGSGKTCPSREDPYLTFDEGWFPDLDALCAPNAGWVAEQIRVSGFRIRYLRSWEWGYPWLNRLPGLRCLGPFMFVMGERGLESLSADLSRQ